MRQKLEDLFMDASGAPRAVQISFAAAVMGLLVGGICLVAAVWWQYDNPLAAMVVGIMQVVAWGWALSWEPDRTPVAYWSPEISQEVDRSPQRDETLHE